MRPDGTGVTQLTDNTASDSEPAFSADGTKIAFVSTRDNGIEEIYEMDADGGNQIRLTNRCDRPKSCVGTGRSADSVRECPGRQP
jgi:Tol biopolymer transport system component